MRAASAPGGSYEKGRRLPLAEVATRDLSHSGWYCAALGATPGRRVARVAPRAGVSGANHAARSDGVRWGFFGAQYAASPRMTRHTPWIFGLCALVACSSSTAPTDSTPQVSPDASARPSPELADGGGVSSEGGADARAPVNPIPLRAPDGSPLDVGVLILGHSTSAQGDYPSKLIKALAADGRNYTVFRAITPSDGGMLWSQLSFAPNDPQYHRVTASQSGAQYCQDSGGTRWSCRRRRLEWAIRGADPAPSECANVGPCAPPVIESCVWHEGGVRREEALVPFDVCWARMDVRIALVQDTTNRSFPIDDTNGDGKVDDLDTFSIAQIKPEAVPCQGSSGAVGGALDANCDGRIDASDASRHVYAQWLEKLSSDLLSSFGARSVDHVFLSHKPAEMGRCNAAYPAEPCSSPNHSIRAATPSRPFDHYYLPTVYWEHAGIDTLFGGAGLDPRIHRASTDVLAMWNATTRCYTSGYDTFAIPASAGRPAAVGSDDSEDDANAAMAAATGCMIDDHVHHNDAGGWVMADVWYRGLRPFLGTP